MLAQSASLCSPAPAPAAAALAEASGGEQPTLSNFDHLQRRAQLHGERALVVSPTETYSYARCHSDVLRLASELHVQGVGRGQLVVLICVHAYLHWALVLACEYLGAVSASFQSPEAANASPVVATAAHVVSDATPLGPLHGASMVEVNQAWLRRVFDAHGAPRALPVQAALDMQSVQRISHSSSTTGAPKAMAHTWAAQEQKMRFIAEQGEVQRHERVLLTLPFTVNSSYLVASTCLRSGGTLVIGPPVWAIASQGVGYFEVLPYALVAILNELPPDFAKPSKLHIVVIGAALAKVVHDRCLSVLCTRIEGRYGTNEVWPIACQVGPNGVGTIACGVEVCIVDAQGARLPAGNIGQVLVRSKSMVLGYVNDPEASARHFAGGWFSTGDTGSLQPSGQLHLLGRWDDVLNLGGHKFAPDSLEMSLQSIAFVLDAGVVALPTGATLDCLCVALVLAPGANMPKLHEEVQAAANGWGTTVVLLFDHLPRTFGGKLQRQALRTVFGQHLAGLTPKSQSAAGASPPSR